MDKTPRGNEVLDFTPSGLPPDYLQAIGLMATSSSHTESVVEMAIAGMLGVDGHVGWAVTTHMPAPLRTSVLRSAAAIRITDPDVLDQLDGLLISLKAAQEKRNTVVHGSWALRPSDSAVMLIKSDARTHVTVDLRPKPVKEIELEALALYEIGMDLMSFLITHSLVPPLPSKAPHAFADPKARKRRRKTDGK